MKSMPALLAIAALLCAGCDTAAPDPGAKPAVPHASTAATNVHVLAPMPMAALGRERTIRVYLPPGYDASSKRYPVLYLQDGQNLFDAATSFLGEWGVDETLNELARQRGIELIVVGIDNGGDHRMQELAPMANAKNLEPEGDAYLAFVVDTVKPYVDAHYRTRAERNDTAIGGSSLGALISHYAMYRYPQTFGKALLFSPSYWYTPAVYGYSTSRQLPSPARLYFYAGGAEGEHMAADMEHMVDVLRASGMPPGSLAEHVVAQAKHNEDAWRAEFGRAITWLFADDEGRPADADGRH